MSMYTFMYRVPSARARVSAAILHTAKWTFDADALAICLSTVQTECKMHHSLLNWLLIFIFIAFYFRLEIPK